MKVIAPSAEAAARIYERLTGSEPAAAPRLVGIASGEDARLWLQTLRQKNTAERKRVLRRVSPSIHRASGG
jgi:hypothetical protein